jgi:hypothetical protein
MSLSEVDAIKKGVVLLTAHCIDGKKINLALQFSTRNVGTI